MRDTLDSLEAFIYALNVDCILIGGGGGIIMWIFYVQMLTQLNLIIF